MSNEIKRRLSEGLSRRFSIKHPPPIVQKKPSRRFSINRAQLNAERDFNIVKILGPMVGKQDVESEESSSSAESKSRPSITVDNTPLRIPTIDPNVKDFLTASPRHSVSKDGRKSRFGSMR